MAGKHVSESYTEQVQILSQSTLNGYNRLFGGQLMQWIDVVAVSYTHLDVYKRQVVFLPKEINFDAYQFVLKESRIWSGYANTIFYTVFGTVFGTRCV